MPEIKRKIKKLGRRAKRISTAISLPTRNFNGERYWLYKTIEEDRGKTDRMAAKLRSQGFKARVTPDMRLRKTGNILIYDIWYRKHR